MQSLTAREKKLLYVLLCTLILIGGTFLLVMPALNKSTDLNDELLNAQAELAVAKSSKVDISNLDTEYQTVLDELNALKDKFYTTMPTEDVDKILTELVYEYNLFPNSLSVSAVAEEEIMSYQEYVDKLTKSSTNSDTATSDSASKVKVYNVSMSITGSVADLQAMINHINEMKTLRVASVSYDNQTSDSKTMNITFKIFLMDI